MNIITLIDIIKKEEDINLSLFRISLTFFSNDEEDEFYDGFDNNFDDDDNDTGDNSDNDGDNEFYDGYDDNFDDDDNDTGGNSDNDGNDEFYDGYDDNFDDDDGDGNKNGNGDDDDEFYDGYDDNFDDDDDDGNKDGDGDDDDEFYDGYDDDDDDDSDDAENDDDKSDDDGDPDDTENGDDKSDDDGGNNDDKNNGDTDSKPEDNKDGNAQDGDNAKDGGDDTKGGDNDKGGDKAPEKAPGSKSDSSIDKARKMEKAPNVGDAAKDAGKDAVKDAGKDAAKDAVKDGAKDAVKEGAGAAAGAAAAGAGSAINAADAIKNAAKNPGDMNQMAESAGQLGVEGAKVAGRAIGDAVAPGAGVAVEKAIDIADKTIGKTGVGKAAKRCCGGCLCCSCMLPIFIPIFIILLPTIIIASIFGVSDTKEAEEEEEKSLFEVLEEEKLSDESVSLKTVLNNTLKEIGYDKYKESLDEEYETGKSTKKNFSASASVIYMMTTNYSIEQLKGPATASRPEDFPKGENINPTYNQYYSMENKHMPLFQDLLDNISESDYNKLSASEKEDANKLKNLFNYEDSSDDSVVKYIDKICKDFLDKEFKNIFNSNTNTTIDKVTLRELFNDVSVNTGDAVYDLPTLHAILNDSEHEIEEYGSKYKPNIKLINHFYDFQDEMAKLELLVYMQAFRQYQLQIKNMRSEASDSYILPDVYHTDEFFEQFSTITDVAGYLSLAQTTYLPALTYEIARETINIWKNPPELTTKEYSGKTFAYIPKLETWYGNYKFSLITVGESTILKCDGVTSRGLDEQSFDKSSNLLKRYNIDDKEKFFELFMSSTGMNAVSGEDNIYTPYELKEGWEMVVNFDFGSTNATTPEVEYTFSTTAYLTPSGTSLPAATNNLNMTLGFMEEYSNETIEKFGLTHTKHLGVDFGIPVGTPVLSMCDGTVVARQYSNAYGFYVSVKDANGYVATYAHGNGTFNVELEEEVTAGTQLMESGSSGNSTGPHLHVEVTKPKTGNPMNPGGELMDPLIYGGIVL